MLSKQPRGSRRGGSSVVRNWYARIKALQRKLGVGYFPAERVEKILADVPDNLDLEGSDNIVIDRGGPRRDE